MFTFVFLSLALVAVNVQGHGMVLDPANRGSLWRYPDRYPDAIPNYTDMGNFCGGKDVQYNQNGGQCGLCGDNFADPRPRANEHGGTYGRGIIANTYSSGSPMPVFVELTQEHKGYFEFSLCALTSAQETEECFKPLSLVDGSAHYVVPGSDKYVNHTMTLQLPNVKCQQCVLRWHYRTGNSYGPCEDGSEALGCGDQEIFRTCSDISIQ